MDRQGLDDLIASEPLADPRIADVFSTLDRAWFVPQGLEMEAYEDRPVALPQGQTTSQPSLIARMVDAAAPGPGDRVLEVGTGYGFQTALLAGLAGKVYSIERHESLASKARENLDRAGIHGADIVVGDGWLGWPAGAPYDAAIVSAAADEVPLALVDQLADGGRLVIPLRNRGSDDVILFVKETGGRLRQVRLVTPARFVPLVHRPDPSEADNTEGEGR
jgi:protein-L-isoaspartate(D-aspartate) O-methyltransferase